MDVDNSDNETKIKSESITPTSTTLNRTDDYKDKTSTVTTVSTDATASSKINPSDSVPVSTSDRINQQKPPDTIHLPSTSSTTSTSFSLISPTTNTVVIEGQSCNVNKSSVSSSGVITSETLSNAPVVNAIGDSSLNDVNIKQEIIDRDSPSPNLPSYAVSKHSVSEILILFFSANLSSLCLCWLCVQNIILIH